MNSDVSQSVLDALTDVDMPRLPPERSPTDTLLVGDLRLPLYRTGCVIVGSGAAGLRAAVELRRRQGEVMVVSQSAWGGTSACSGSDKQTLHTANTAGRGDNFQAMAQAIRSGGAMDEDTAYIEAVGSVRAMASLQYLGLALPQDAQGGTLRYQTDHDEVGRATSCGPRTSRLMVQVLAQEAIRLGVAILNQTTVVHLLVDGEGHAKRVCGLLAMRNRDRSPANPMGLCVFQAPVVVLAAGGPGEMYRDSVYPNGCFGVLGLALEAGIALVNLTESQFGIGTRREGFPWNLSGTYVQAMPHICSLDAKGQEHHFLAEYYRTTQELASNIFRKGYQWPFHATRMLDFGSSLVDLAILRENQAGRRVVMDFNRNPLPAQDGMPFSLNRLDDDVAAYLAKAGAVHSLPVDRLRHMNPLSIELYRRYKVDITAHPLEFAVNNQHMNGGVAVDSWGRTTLPGCYGVGEAAGTHGVTRPGGAALNAGQVFGTRVGEHVAASGLAHAPAPFDIAPHAAVGLAKLRAVLQPASHHSVKSVRTAVQTRMSEHAGVLCAAGPVADALVQARALNAALRSEGIAFGRTAEAARAVQWQQMALASEAVLTALHHFIASGGGSRGSRAICDPAGGDVPQTVHGPLNAFRFRRERQDHKAEQIVIRYDGGTFQVGARPNRRLDPDLQPFFERDWPDWLMGRVFDTTPVPPC